MTNKKSEDRYTRLPRWAEMELKTLSDELAKCRKQLAEIKGSSLTNPKTRQTNWVALAEYDQMYRDYNQTEPTICQILKGRGHPNTLEYQILWCFFDSLQHFANSRARFYSFVDRGEYTQYWAPELCIRNATTRMIMLDSRERYFDILKNTPIQELDPCFDAGAWVIATRSEEFFNAIEQLDGTANILVSYKNVPCGHPRATHAEMQPHNGYDHFSATIFLDNLTQFRTVRQVINKFVIPLPRKGTE